MNNILVLGGTQFFGKRLVERLIEEGKNVTIATRGKTADSFGDKVNRLILDREDKDSIISALKGQTWDIVYDQTCYSPQEVKDVADVLKGKVKRYIFTSSQAVYDYGTLHKEENFNPNEFKYEFKGRREYPGYEGYQEAKRAAEAYLFQETDFEVVAVRFSIVVGRDDYTNRLKFHVDKVLNDEPIGIKNVDSRYGYILSHEAASFLYEIGQSSFTGPINPGCAGDISMRELLDMIENQTGKSAIVTDELNQTNASPFSLPGSWSTNTEKAETLGFTFSDLHKTLNELIEFYKSENVKVVNK
ncbi:NAD-dependent epimerase/dehydratase family protein [Bacillus sp. 31A1R]|uniref:NAD-dependent epimerase/dehydratase family protein n=1 Tax=Robertmurraya mangrovi TaxID=3098077 RepID=A0ABU5J2Z8_9BACI|nr:NAD-dependent epimerase/dehydratase family protein [Bacillus sp. 31A1R]MDZ5473796.1 NAD-dependent epimerase/dehydratase family protein [Bacillus sp. 31A1R]